MKKINCFVSSFIIVLTLFGCSQLDFDEELKLKSGENGENSDLNYNVGLESAKTFVRILNNSVEADSVFFEIEPVVYSSDTLLYVVNYAKNNGWLIVSGDKRTESILATSEEGEFSFEEANPGVLTWLDALSEDILALKQSDYVDTTSADYELWNNIELYNNPLKRAIADEYEGYWELSYIESEQLTPVRKGPFTRTEWGQGHPWNEVVPHVQDYSERCLVGCVAVAGAQMLYYLNGKIGIPEKMYRKGVCSGWSKNEDGFLGKGYSYGFSFSEPSSSAWDEMEIIRSYRSTPETKYSAILMGYVGNDIGMKYGGEKSSADTEDLVGLFSSYGISSSFQDYNSSKVLSSLNSEMPVILSAKRTKKRVKIIITWATRYINGHAWIVDGYEKQRRRYTYHYIWKSSGDYDNPQTRPLKAVTLQERLPRTKTSTSISSTTYLRMNWGYNGSYDNKKYTLTGDWRTSSDRNYQYKRRMIASLAKK
ncbi:MAG: C10 family peptidase [bacterium]